MNADAGRFDEIAPFSRAETLLKSSAGGFNAFAQSLRPLRKALHLVETMGSLTAIKSAARLARQLDQFEPTITMIGQIKSGKTTLVNSMIGWPDLLPADVNPWTSVVTSLHLRPRELTPPTSAKFRFFENGEWDRLVQGGGRIGELAGRAGADDELSTIKAQVEMMRAKSKARLGRKFELLLGREHSYGYFDRELVERYVCLGDDFDADAPSQDHQGRFADITKSADLSMQQRAFPINLCIRDTPGVNDTFMMREQITIKSIRDSRICVVVLSAHQALSSTDLALIRLISNVKSREVIIFVNRIDELSDPGTQVPQIRQSILDTLTKHKGPTDVQVIFGAALWAHAAASGDVVLLPKASQAAMFNWAGAIDIQDSDVSDPHALLWELSGLPALYDAIADRVIEGEGMELRAQVAVAARNLLNGIRVADNLSAKTRIDSARLQIAPDQIARRLGQIESEGLARLDAGLRELGHAFDEKVDRSHLSFLTRATEELARHLEFYGENSAWTYDPSGLRILLNSAYKIFGTKCQAAYGKATQQVVADLSLLLQQALNVPPDLFTPQSPPAPRIPPPVSLGQTIALDLRGSWWKGWWMRRKSYQAHAQSFHDLIKAETDTLVRDLTHDQAVVIRDLMLAQMQDFLAEQTASLSALTQDRQLSSQRIDALFGVRELQERDAALTEALASLEGYQT